MINKLLLLFVTILLAGCEQVDLAVKELGLSQELKVGECYAYRKVPVEIDMLQFTDDKNPKDRSEIYKATDYIQIREVGNKSYEFCWIFKNPVGKRFCYGSSIGNKQKLHDFISDPIDCPLLERFPKEDEKKK